MRWSVIFALLTTVACHSSEKPSDFILRVAVSGPLEPFSVGVGSSSTTAAQDLVFDTFLVPDEQGVLVSRVLRRWERIDGQRYRIQLDPTVRFSDGSSMAIEDAVTSLAAMGLRGSVRGEWLEVEPIDANLLVESTLLYTVLYKKTAAGPLGTGSFRLVEQTENRILLERIHPQPRRIRRVEIVAYPTPREVLARVIRGDTNAALDLDERQLELTEGITKLKPIRNLSHTVLTVVFNHNRLSPAIRRKIATTLPIRDIASVFANGCHAETSAGAPTKYQPLPPGRRLEVLVPKMIVSMDRAALAVRRALGVRGGEVVQVEMTELLTRVKAGAFDIVMVAIVAWPDPVMASLWRTDAPYNLTRYSNRRVDEAFDKGDIAAAKVELAADVPYLPICRRERIGVVDSRIKNPRMGWWGLLDTLPDWEVEE